MKTQTQPLSQLQRPQSTVRSTSANQSSNLDLAAPRAKRRWLLLLFALIVAPTAAYAVVHIWSQRSSADGQVTVAVMRANLPIVLTAGGELQSGQSMDVYSEIQGSTKIVEMLPEGTHVKEGQVVMRLDPSNVVDRLAQQQIRMTQVESLASAAVENLKIQQNLADSKIAAAQLELTLAELDQKKYVEGEFGVSLNDLKGSIALAEADLQEAEDTLEFYRELVKKGFRTPEQLRAKEQSLKRAEYNLSRDREKLHVLEEFTRERQVTELDAKAEQAKRELERARSSTRATLVKAKTDVEVAKATAKLERNQLVKLQQQLADCEVKAPKSGILVYGNTDKTRVELGATVFFKQKLFSIPDMDKMQVQAWIHESVVKKVRTGLTAEIRVEAYPKLVLHGSVANIANFYDSTREWVSGGVKEYAATIEIEELPDVELKPGMTAQSKIFVDEIPNTLIVPIQAVVPYKGKYASYVWTRSGPERRIVSIGESNDNFVQILEGLNEGESLTLDARMRAAKELDESKQSGSGTNSTAGLGSSSVTDEGRAEEAAAEEPAAEGEAQEADPPGDEGASSPSDVLLGSEPPSILDESAVPENSLSNPLAPGEQSAPPSSVPEEQ